MSTAVLLHCCTAEHAEPPAVLLRPAQLHMLSCTCSGHQASQLPKHAELGHLLRAAAKLCMLRHLQGAAAAQQLLRH